jgi:hypothetical protein
MAARADVVRARPIPNVAIPQRLSAAVKKQTGAPAYAGAPAKELNLKIARDGDGHRLVSYTDATQARRRRAATRPPRPMRAKAPGAGIASTLKDAVPPWKLRLVRGITSPSS